MTTVSIVGDRDRDRLMNTFSSLMGTIAGLAMGCAITVSSMISGPQTTSCFLPPTTPVSRAISWTLSGSRVILVVTVLVIVGTTTSSSGSVVSTNSGWS